MGIGDQLIATGIARGAAQRGKRVAFGSQGRIRWDQHSEAIFRGNPNIAPPGSERAPDLEWVPYFKGSRLYNVHDRSRNRWVWNMEFRAPRGEIFLSGPEQAAGKRIGSGFVVIEPEVPAWKASSVNKDWGRANYQKVADGLKSGGWRVVQFVHPKSRPPLRGVDAVRTRDFRDALALMGNAALYIGPEGGLHHGAAAVDIPAVVIFGGFIPPQVTGYDTHTNLTGGAEACGSLSLCQHCRDALARISPEEVLDAAGRHL